VLLGDGADRESLQRLVDELKLGDRVLLAGFQSNPYAWLARADLFAVSSIWEGSSMVLAEALSLGIASVSTRCPSGPEEMLAGGHYGTLVPVGDADALARAMIATLDSPLPADFLKQAVADYHVDVSARNYLATLGLAEPPVSR
jgi:glycosyltransferase involved in cell wall biosynthesis